MARKQARGLPIPASPPGGGVEMTSEMAAISLQRRTRKESKPAIGGRDKAVIAQTVRSRGEQRRDIGRVPTLTLHP